MAGFGRHKDKMRKEKRGKGGGSARSALLVSWSVQSRNRAAKLMSISRPSNQIHCSNPHSPSIFFSSRCKKRRIRQGGMAVLSPELDNQPHVVDHVQPEHYSNLGPRLLILGMVFAP